LLLVAGGPASDATFSAIKQSNFNPALSLASPGYLFVTAGAWGQTLFWRALLANQAVAWMLLGLACLLLPRMWQERAGNRQTARSRRVHSRAHHGKLMEPNPVLWLACRDDQPSLAFLGLAFVASGGFVVAF